MAITSTATPKDNRWHALRLRWDAVDRRTERWLLLTFYALIILTIAVEVIRRFVLNYSSVWGEELARYAFIYLAWLAAAAAVRDRAHIRIDVLINLGGPRMKRLGWWITDVCTLVLAVWALYLSVAPGPDVHPVRIGDAGPAGVPGAVSRRHSHGLSADRLAGDPVHAGRCPSDAAR